MNFIEQDSVSSNFSKIKFENANNTKKTTLDSSYLSFIENIEAPILFVDKKGRIQKANAATAKAFGYDTTFLLGKEIDLLIPGGKEILCESVDNVLGYDESSFTRSPVETVGVRKDGEAIWLAITQEAFDIDEKDIFAFLLADITKQKQTEAELQKNHNRYETLLDAVGGVVWEADAFPVKLTYISRQIEKLLGYPVERWLNDEEFWKTLIHPEDKWVIEYSCEAIKKHRPYEFECRVMAVDGREVWLRHTANFVFKEGDVIKQRGLMIDITEQNRTANELKASKQLYQDLVENANDVIYSHDLNGRIISLNDAGLRVLGYTHEDCLAMSMYQIIAPEYAEKAREMMARKIAGEKQTVYEIEILRKDGQRVIVEVNTKLIYENGKPFAVQGIARDVTEKNLLQAQLHQAQKMETVGRLAGGIAHDFNNILTVILGKTELALMQLKESNGQLRDDVEEIKHSAERAANMTQQILAFSRKQVLQPRILNINETVSNMSKMLKRLIGEDIELETKLHNGVRSVKVDLSQVEQVIMNLVVNARDAMPKGGKLTIETANVVLDEMYARQHLNARPGHYVMLAVSDDGVGMSDKVLKRVFEPFFTTKEADKGTGLGLSTVYGIVKQSGGYVWVYSEEGIGSTFKIYLPMVDEPETALLPSETPSVLVEGNETILLVEDDTAIREMVKEMLSIMGYTVLEASNGNRAIEISRNTTERIDLLITDVVMPGISGRQLAQQMSKLREDMKILYMTGYTDEAILRHGILEHGLRFVQKPFTFETLAFKVRELLDSKQ